MQYGQDVQQKNWFRRKRGKHWVYGCSLLLAGLRVLFLGGLSPVAAEEVNPAVLEPAAAEERADETAEAPAEDGPNLAAEVPAPAADLAEVQETDGPAEQATAPQPAAEGTAAPAADQPVAAVEEDSPEATPAANQEASGYRTNLEGLESKSGTWEERADGLYSNAIGQGDSFLYSQSQGTDFVYETEVTFLQDIGAAALVLRSNNDEANKESYAVNLDAETLKVKFWRWQANSDYQLIDEKQIKAAADNRYHLKVVALGSWISYYVNQELVASLGDYTVQREDKGQSTYLPEGYFGLLNWNGEMVFQNTRYQAITPQTTPLLDDITVTAETGAVEGKPQFVATEPITLQYVSHEADKVRLAVQARSEQAVLAITDEAGNRYALTDEIPIAVGANYLTVTSRVTLADGSSAEVSYRVNVHRRQSAEVYYNELYRGQYHYSVKDGWANDPNGLIYYNGTYHFFYQFYDDTKWGPMHWGHAVSKDLIHWEEKPIAFYPDENGSMFSGSMVADPDNTSGLFPEGQGGLVAIITANGNGQRVKLAYSTDEGETWTKVDRIAADWTNDPLDNPDFRDPKVFRWENKWFMVIAGGPLRIYSSDNLLDWQVETTYADLHTECPDLFPIQTEGGIKWVLSRGGRGYKVGDFRQVDGKWTFLPDAAYETTDGVMNFGKDSYAAMTYYVQDFGTAANPTLPKLIVSNWMNNWDYSTLVADSLGQAFNGTFNLNLELGLTLEDGKYSLTQTPIEAYKTLRDIDQARQLTDVAVTEDNTLLSDFKGNSYEIVSTFRPSEGTKKVGFNVRTGEGEATRVIYDLETETLSIDRSRSGVIINTAFAEVNKQTAVTRNADGSIDLHLYVDKSSVEVFAKGYTVSGANQIFAAPTSQGLSVFAEGGSAQADIAVYPLRSIWAEKQDVTDALALIPAGQTEQRLNVGGSADLRAYIMPDTAAQDIVWTVEGQDLVTTKGLINVFAASEGQNPGQAYSLQFGSGDTVRLFRFGGETIAEQPMGITVSDGQSHHIKLVKSGQTFTVFVDGKEVMNYTFANVDSYFYQPYIGIGLWDGDIAVQNLLVTDLTVPEEPKPLQEGYNTIDGQLYYVDSKGVLAKGLRVHGSGTIRYYDPATGASVTNQLVTLDNGDSYYFDKWGRALKGYQTIDGQLYYFDSKGVRAKGLRVHGSGTIRYYDPVSGASVTNQLVTLANGDSYYFDKRGRALKGEHVIDGVSYRFADDGRLIQQA